jgi:Fic-DOC domain mobile mystery protein B
MILTFNYAPGATPLDPDEIAGLIPPHITTHQQLNEWEATNILKAENWLTSTPAKKHFLTIDFIKLLHKKMFDDSWKWAGTFRTTAKNIGIDQSMITTELKNLVEDAAYQIKENSYSMDEIAYRFHHRLVLIHPFPNGNGRHARMMTDLLLVQNNYPRFTWGNQQLETQTPTRKKYIKALRDADKHRYAALAGFVRS